MYSNINLSNIKMDRHPLNPSTLSLVEHLRASGTIPPIHVMLLKNGQYKICDGRHRVTALKLLGRKTVLAIFNKKRL